MGSGGGWPWPSSAPRCGAGGWEVWDGRCVGKGVHGAPKTSKRRLTRAPFGGRRIGSETDFVRQRAGRCAAPRATNALGMRPLTARLSSKACQPCQPLHFGFGRELPCRRRRCRTPSCSAPLCAAPAPPLRCAPAAALWPLRAVRGCTVRLYRLRHTRLAGGVGRSQPTQQPSKILSLRLCLWIRYGKVLCGVRVVH